jgi:autotransporter translocation and assembly factor TamB
MRLLRLFFISALSLLLLVFGALLLLQSRWTKEQLGEVLQEVALQAGVQLSIEKIEGKLPLKWTFTNIHVKLAEGDTLDVDSLQVRMALLPLLRGHFAISYLHAGQTTITYATSPTSTSSGMKKIKGSFSVRSATLDNILLINRVTQEQMNYNLQGRGRYLRGGRSFFIETALHSDSVDLKLFCEGNKKLDQLQTHLELAVRSQEAFAPFYKIPYLEAFEMKLRSEGPWQTLQAAFFSGQALSSRPLTGVLDLSITKTALPPLDSLQLSSHFSLFANRSWTLSQLTVLSPLAQLQGSAEFSPEGMPLALHASVTLPDLSHFSTHLKGHARGELGLRDQRCHLLLSTPTFAIDHTTFEKGKVEMLAHIKQSIWSADVQVEAHHPTLGYKVSSELTLLPHQLEIRSFDLTSHLGRIAGDLTLQAKNNIQGGLSFQISDLAPLSELAGIDLAGQAGGEVQFTGDEVSCHILGKKLKAGDCISSRFVLDLSHVKLSAPLQGSLNMTSDEAYVRDIHLTSFAYKMGWNGTLWNYHLQAQGGWKGPFNLLTHGQVGYSSHIFTLLCDELSGTLLDKQVALQRPCQLELSKESFKVDTLDLSINEGHFLLASGWNPTHASLRMVAEHFPLDFLTLLTPRFSLKGLSSLDIDLEGKKEELTGHMHILLERADIYPAGSKEPIQTKGSLQAHMENNVLQFHTHLVATDQQLCEISLTTPLQFEVSSLKVTIPESASLVGQCTIEGHTEQLFDFINLGSQRVGGFLSCRLLLSGTKADPIIYGPLSIQGGFYENYFIGIAIKDADITAQAIGHELVVEKATTTDGEKGTSNSTAVFYFKPQLPFSVEGTVHHFRVIRFDWLTGACSGPFTINGDLRGALAKGKLTLDEADVTIPDQLPSEQPTLPITFINEPATHLEKFHYSEPYPFRYDLDIHGDHDLKLSGRGIEAELEGDIHMTGKNLSVIASGALHTKKGKFAFAGKDFIINQGEILFSEEKSFLNITSTVEYPSLTVTVHFRGNLRSPQLIFESNPSLPTSSILARILFNKEVSELSAGQAVQLANTIVTLSGSSGPNVLESIRKSLGIDRFSVSVPATKETGYVSVEIGKYITKGVMISLTQSTKSSQVKVEVELKSGFILEAETQEDNQGKFSFKWNKNY